MPTPTPFLFMTLGVSLAIFGIRVKKGSGTARLPGGTRVRYSTIDMPVRSRAGNASIALGGNIFILGILTLSPGPYVFIPMAIWILFLYPYYSRAKDLQTAARNAARLRSTD